MDYIDTSIILLTYKGKVLLTQRDAILPAPDMWSFIGAVKKLGESFEEAIYRKVRKDTGLTLLNVEFISKWYYKKKRKYFFRAELNDIDVNSIVRHEGHLLQFFDIRELENLPLAVSTRLFIAKHKDILQKVSHTYRDQITKV